MLEARSMRNSHFATSERIMGKDLAIHILSHIQKWSLDILDCRG